MALVMKIRVARMGPNSRILSYLIKILRIIQQNVQAVWSEDYRPRTMDSDTQQSSPWIGSEGGLSEGYLHAARRDTKADVNTGFGNCRGTSSAGRGKWEKPRDGFFSLPATQSRRPSLPSAALKSKL